MLCLYIHIHFRWFSRVNLEAAFGSDKSSTSEPAAATLSASGSEALREVGKTGLSPTLNMSSLEIMMRRLMEEQENRMQKHISEACTKTISSQIQPLRQEIAVECTEHTKE